MYVQNSNGEFRQIPIVPRLESEQYVGNWRNVRVGYVTQRELPDLVVVEGRWDEEDNYVRIFKGLSEPPFFDFDDPVLNMQLPNAAPDVEIMDVNRDGYKDLYVLQASELHGYCSVKGGENSGLSGYWGGGKPSKGWVPPHNRVTDLLLLGGRDTETLNFEFTSHLMDFHGRGCSGVAKRFGNDNTLLVSRSRILHYGTCVMNCCRVLLCF